MTHFSAILLMKARSQEEHPALKSDCLVHTVYFGLFKQVRKLVPGSPEEDMCFLTFELMKIPPV